MAVVRSARNHARAVPRIDFVGNSIGPRTQFDAPGRLRLLDACDQAHAPVAFSCRSAACGTCRVEVVSGGELLEPAGSDEIEVLAAFEAPPSHRLACQAVVTDTAGCLVLRWVDE
jgi:ferredoxin